MSAIYSNDLLYIDASGMKDEIESMRRILCREKYEKVIYRTIKEVAKKTRTIVWNEVKEDYRVKKSWVYAGFGKTETTLHAGGEFPITCTIPLTGKKGVLGPTFTAWGGSNQKGKMHIVKAKIVKSGTSTLPRTMPWKLGAQKPFRADGKIWRRLTKERKPIAIVSGVSMPQMPMNRSREDIERELQKYMEDRLLHNFDYILNKESAR